jgi:23S rRNA (uridine2552-2'-O)-methyltransferase
MMKKVHDHYFHRAKREGYAARSAYKLEEMDRCRRLLRPGMRVLDLGCAPGSWLQYAARRVGAHGRVLGVDRSPVTLALPPQAHTLLADVFTLAPAMLLEGGLFDGILSDMAPRTTGVPGADAARSAELVLRALALARDVLKPGGFLLAKVFQGARMAELRAAFAAAFDRVSIEKPKASRAESVEVFLLGMGFRRLEVPAHQ